MEKTRDHVSLNYEKGLLLESIEEDMKKDGFKGDILDADFFDWVRKPKQQSTSEHQLRGKPKLFGKRLRFESAEIGVDNSLTSEQVDHTFDNS
jgi:hypothetical protein